jgi:DNA replication initiation complex subunit (GINS family)
MSEEISYEHLFDLLRREKTREDLQSIDKHFYIDVFGSLKSKELIIKQKESQTSLVININLEKEKIEIKNIRKILNEIRDRRQKKIILLALSRAKIPSTIINHEVFTTDENVFFNNCVKLFREFKENNYSSTEKIESKPIIEKEEPKEEFEPLPLKEEIVAKTESDPLPKDEKTVIIQNSKIEFLTDMSNFYGPKKELLGPFKKGDIAELPKIIAKILIDKGRAKKV